MGVKVTGQKKLIAELERRFGKVNMQRITDAALSEGARVFVAELRRQFASWKDTGASYDEIMISKPMTVGGSRIIKIHWRGPKNRYRIIHLNEWGTVNNPNPRGKGAIARAMRNAEKEYIRAVRKAIERGI